MDKRKLNGGNSTKALGVDKRKNEYKEVLDNALTSDDLVKVVKMLFTKSIEDKDVNASKIILEYYLGKPTQNVVQENINYAEEKLTIEEINEIKGVIESKY